MERDTKRKTVWVPCTSTDQARMLQPQQWTLEIQVSPWQAGLNCRVQLNRCHLFTHIGVIQSIFFLTPTPMEIFLLGFEMIKEKTNPGLKKGKAFVCISLVLIQKDCLFGRIRRNELLIDFHCCIGLHQSTNGFMSRRSGTETQTRLTCFLTVKRLGPRLPGYKFLFILWHWTKEGRF